MHPVRFRIVQTFLGDRELSVGALRGELPDVPAATLYRQVGTLVDAGVLEVTGERKVRGVTERSYRLTGAGISVDATEASSLDRDDHARLFLTFLAGLAASFDGYLSQNSFDLARDLVGYRTHVFHLDDEELVEMIGALNQAVLPYAGREPGKGRRPRRFTTVVIPG